MAGVDKAKTGFIFVNCNQLIKAPWNYKKDNKEKARALKNNIKQNGQVENIIVRELKDKKYEIVNGNHRYDTFKDLDFKQVFVFNMGKVPLLAAKRLAIETNETKFEADEVNLARTINELIAGFSLDNLESTMPFSDSEFSEFSTKLLGKSSDAEPKVDKGDELRLKWKTKVGQLWRLGDHRIICGDSSDEKMVSKVIAKDKIRMVWTDPPYGVDFESCVARLKKKRNRFRAKSRVINDNMKSKELTSFTTKVLRLALENGVPGCVVYLSCPPGPNLRVFQEVFNASGFTWKHTLVWVKNAFVLGRSDYHYRHEFVLYGWNENGAHYWGGGKNKQSVFEIPRSMKSLEHPTMKPISLIEPMVLNSSKPGEVIYDPFVGSGSTLIACENLKRKCRAVEISPEYVAVCIQRWVDIIGEKPVLLQG